MILAVNELCDGSPSAETVALMRSLDRPLPYNTSPTFLFGTRFDVAFINQEMIEDMPGNAVCFKSEDEGISMLIIYILFSMSIFIKFSPRYLTFNNEC